MKNARKNWDVNIEEKRTVLNPGLNRRIILNWILTKLVWVGGKKTGFIRLRKGSCGMQL
jgi:hypothetical protein